MSAPTTRPQLEWLEVPAWAIPVWVTLDGFAWEADPLMDAISALVKAGCEREADIASRLAMPRSLVRAAVDHLAAHGDIARDDSGAIHVQAQHQDESDEHVVATREAWVAWDPLHDRPILQVWLDRDPPGTDLRKSEDGAQYRSPPHSRRLHDSLRLLAMVTGLEVLERRGADGAHLLDTARIRTLAVRGRGRPRRTSTWVGVEHRPTGPVVWRPSVARQAEQPGELDPLGWDGLRRRFGERTADLDRMQDNYQSERVSAVLTAAGYDSLDALRLAAQRECATGLDGLGTGEGWAQSREAIVNAIIDQRMALAQGADWRRLARGWADAIEALTVEAVTHARRVVEGMDHLPTVPPETARRLARLTGKTWDLVERLSSNKNDFKELRYKLRQDQDSLGHRLMALAVAAMGDRTIRKSLEDADQRVRSAFPASKGLFDELDRARLTRNAIAHRRTRAEDIDVAAIRERVFLLGRALMGSWLGG